MRRRKNSAPDHKKRIRMRRGFGQVIYLGEGRTHPYAVYPPAKRFDRNGVRIREKAICYVSTWEAGFAVLVAYNSGRYNPGDEVEIEKKIRGEKPAAQSKDMTELMLSIMADYTAYTTARKPGGKTFAMYYDEYYEHKYSTTKGMQLSDSARKVDKYGFKMCAEIHDTPLSDLNITILQRLLNSLEKPTNKKHAKLVISQVFKYAIMMGEKVTDPTKFLDESSNVEVKHGKAFTDAELAKLWELRDDPVAEMVLIMCFTGFRILAYTCMDEVNLEQWYMQGGVKTKESKHRIVPIHTMIRPLVEKRMKRDGALLTVTPDTFAKKMKALFAKYPDVFAQDHHPHDCRHTFASLCERFGVRENDKKRLLGHAFKDITNSVYVHRGLEDLRKQVELIDAVAILLRHKDKKHPET